MQTKIYESNPHVYQKYKHSDGDTMFHVQVPKFKMACDIFANINTNRRYNKAAILNKNIHQCEFEPEVLQTKSLLDY